MEKTLEELPIPDLNAWRVASDAIKRLGREKNLSRSKPFRAAKDRDIAAQREILDQYEKDKRLRDDKVQEIGHYQRMIKNIESDILNKDQIESERLSLEQFLLELSLHTG